MIGLYSPVHVPLHHTGMLVVVRHTHEDFATGADTSDE